MYAEVHYGAASLYILDLISHQEFWFDLFIMYSKLDDIRLGIVTSVVFVLVPYPVCMYNFKSTDFKCK